MLQRADDWEARFRRVIENYAAESFAWGRADCATFAADCVEAVTGRDVLGPIRGTYGTRLAARARMKARGWNSAADAAACVLGAMGAPEIPPRFASVGDIGVTPDDVLCVRTPVGFVSVAGVGLAKAPSVDKAWAIASCRS